MNLDIDNALLLTLMISQSRWSRELITLKSKGSIVSWNRICTKVIAAARASLKQASKAGDLISTGTKIFDFYTWCIWIFNHNALDFYHDSLRWNVAMTCCRFKYHHAQHVLYGSSGQRKRGLYHQTAEWHSNAESIFRHRTPDPAELNVDFNFVLNFIWTLHCAYIFQLLLL